jgi:tRNA dimethylallyltransferase
VAFPVKSESPLVVVAGPTGSGKSTLAIHLAVRFAGEIVNFDSLQVYRGFDVGTAKTPEDERTGVPHHLIDIVDADEVFTAGDFARAASAAIAGITARGHLPILTGGTGFYLRALLDGLFEGPARDEALRKRLAAKEARRPGALHRLLRRLDGASAARIHASDTQKTMRALEVRLLTGRPMAEAFAEVSPGLTGYRVLKLGLDPDRAQLYERLNARALAMFEHGLLDETRALLLRHDPKAKPFGSLGYLQATRHLSGEMPLEAAIA